MTTPQPTGLRAWWWNRTLAKAVVRGNFEQAQHALAKGAQAEQETPGTGGFKSEGPSLLARAAQNGRADLVDLLIRHGANPNKAAIPDGRAAAHWAAQGANEERPGSLDVLWVLHQHDPQLLNKPVRFTRKGDPSSAWDTMNDAVRAALEARIQAQHLQTTLPVMEEVARPRARL